VQQGLELKVSQAGDMEADSKTLSVELDAVKGQCRDSKKEIEALQVQHTASQQKLQAALAEAEALKEQYTASQEELEMKVKALKMQLIAMDELRAQSEQLAAKIKEMEEETKERELSAAANLKALILEKNDVEMSVNGRSQEIAEELKALRCQVDFLNTDLQQKCSELEVVSSALDTQSHDLLDLSEENRLDTDRSVLEMSVLKEESAASKSQIAELSKSIHAMKGQLQKTAAKFVEKIRTLKAQVLVLLAGLKCSYSNADVSAGQ
jgi:chromosome segregation ATPase